MPAPNLDFPPLVFDDGFAPTAPMVWEDDRGLPADDGLPSPWGAEVIGQPCVIELAGDGLGPRTLRATLLAWEPTQRRCRYQAAPDYVDTVLPFARLRSVTLTKVRRAGFAGAEGVTEGAVRYALECVDGVQLQGVSDGRADRADGHYLARRVDEEGGTLRLFVPHAAVDAARFDGSVLAVSRCDKEAAALAAMVPAGASRFEPVRTHVELAAALIAQQDGPVLRLGDVLLSLGLVSEERLDAELACTDGPSAALPLGERLVRSGLLTPEDLQRALHMKMGYPVIDVRRYPIDRPLLKRLPYGRAAALGVLPVASLDQRIVVVMDDPGRLRSLKELEFELDATLVPALPWNDTLDVLRAEAYGVQSIGGSGVGWFG